MTVLVGVLLLVGAILLFRPRPPLATTTVPVAQPSVIPLPTIAPLADPSPSLPSAVVAKPAQPPLKMTGGSSKTRKLRLSQAEDPFESGGSTYKGKKAKAVSSSAASLPKKHTRHPASPSQPKVKRTIIRNFNHARNLSISVGLARTSFDAEVQAQARDTAQSLLTEGSAFYEKGDYAGALEKFKAAYAAYDSPKLLFNIGQANRDLGRPVEALEAFERFLIGCLMPRLRPSRRPSDRSKNCRNNSDASASNAKPSMRPSASTAKRLVSTPLPRLLWATPGRHQVTARHWNFAPAIEDVEVRVGNVQPVRIALLAPTAQAAVPETHLPAPTTPPSELTVNQPASPNAVAPGWWLGRKWTWIAAGSAVAFGAGAITAGLVMQSKYDSLNRSCGSASPTQLGCSEADIGGVATRRNVANVMWALAGASAVTAGVLFFVEDHRVAVSPVVGDTFGFAASLRY